MESIVLIPGIIAALWGLRLGPVRVFLNFYLPTLFLLPEYYRWTVPGIPKVTFSQPVIVDKYLTIAEDHSLLGYGRSNFPIVAGMTSIDNYYLLLSLWHGFIASGLLIILLFGTTIRLFRRGLRETDLGFPRPSLAFTLAGILVAVIFTLATVYMGTQVIPIVAMLLGWSDAYLLGPMCSGVSESAASVELTAPLRFTRVVT